MEGHWSGVRMVHAQCRRSRGRSPGRRTGPSRSRCRSYRCRSPRSGGARRSSPTYRCRSQRCAQPAQRITSTLSSTVHEKLNLRRGNLLGNNYPYCNSMHETAERTEQSSGGADRALTSLRQENIFCVESARYVPQIDNYFQISQRSISRLVHIRAAVVHFDGFNGSNVCSVSFGKERFVGARRPSKSDGETRKGQERARWAQIGRSLVVTVRRSKPGERQRVTLPRAGASERQQDRQPAGRRQAALPTGGQVKAQGRIPMAMQARMVERCQLA